RIFLIFPARLPYKHKYHDVRIRHPNPIRATHARIQLVMDGVPSWCCECRSTVLVEGAICLSWTRGVDGVRRNDQTHSLHPAISTVLYNPYRIHHPAPPRI